jgi:hypothetical protein
LFPFGRQVWPAWIQVRIPYPDPLTPLNPDPIRIWIRNTGFSAALYCTSSNADSNAFRNNTQRERRFLREFFAIQKFNQRISNNSTYHFKKYASRLKVIFEILTVLNASDRTEAVLAPEMREPDQGYDHTISRGILKTLSTHIFSHQTIPLKQQNNKNIPVNGQIAPG